MQVVSGRAASGAGQGERGGMSPNAGLDWRARRLRSLPPAPLVARSAHLHTMQRGPRPRLLRLGRLSAREAAAAAVGVCGTVALYDWLFGQQHARVLRPQQQQEAPTERGRGGGGQSASSPPPTTARPPPITRPA